VVESESSLQLPLESSEEAVEGLEHSMKDEVLALPLAVVSRLVVMMMWTMTVVVVAPLVEEAHQSDERLHMIVQLVDIHQCCHVTHCTQAATYECRS
jgi:hypothetical protein